MIQLTNIDHQFLELSLLRQDIQELSELMLSISKNSESGVFSLALSPLIGLVVEGANKYFERQKLFANKSFDYEIYKESITKLRTSMKIFDDTKGGKESLIQKLNLFQIKSSEWMNFRKNYWQRQIARFLQPDIGLYFLEGKLLFITLAGFFAMGLTLDQIERMKDEDFANISKNAFYYGHWIGQFLTISRKLIEEDLKSIIYLNQELKMPELEISQNDFLAKNLSVQVAKKAHLAQKEESFALLFVLSQVNMAFHLLPILLPKESILLLRLKFLTAYHAYSSLKHFSLKDTSPIKTIITKIEALPKLPNEKKIRNSLAHYGFGEGRKYINNYDLPIEQLVEGFSRQSCCFVDELISEKLRLISNWTDANLSKNCLSNSRAFLGKNT